MSENAPANQSTRWSPAPWTIPHEAPSERGPIRIESAAGYHVATASTPDNARLIAAAPGLYAVLKNLLPMLEDHPDCADLHCPISAAAEAARAVIRYAEMGS